MTEAQLKEIKERLAKLCHEQWSGWMRYMFSHTTFNKNNRTCIIPAWAVERWQGQINTDYKDLSEEEQDSDRKEADKFIELLDISALIDEIERLNGLNICMECGNRIDSLCCNICQECYGKQIEL